MGNQSSNCFSAESRRAKLPVAVAELQEPVHVVCPLRHLHGDRRQSAMKADERSSGGRVYVLSGVCSRVMESNVAVTESVCGSIWRRKRRRLVGPQPAVTEGGERPGRLSVGEKRRDIALSYRRRKPYWKPVLEPIHEAI